jgi:hypothetical protein
MDSLTISFHKKSEELPRLELFLEAVSLGRDWQLILWGGKKHIGALVLAEPGQPARFLSCPGHREASISCELAGLCAKELNCNIAFCCGIHYDNITKAEIEEVLLLARSLVRDFLADIARTRVQSIDTSR